MKVIKRMVVTSSSNSKNQVHEYLKDIDLGFEDVDVNVQDIYMDVEKLKSRKVVDKEEFEKVIASIDKRLEKIEAGLYALLKEKLGGKANEE